MTLEGRANTIMLRRIIGIGSNLGTGVLNMGACVVGFFRFVIYQNNMATLMSTYIRTQSHITGMYIYPHLWGWNLVYAIFCACYYYVRYYVPFWSMTQCMLPCAHSIFPKIWSHSIIFYGNHQGRA